MPRAKRAKGQRGRSGSSAAGKKEPQVQSDEENRDSDSDVIDLAEDAPDDPVQIDLSKPAARGKRTARGGARKKSPAKQQRKPRARRNATKRVVDPNDSDDEDDGDEDEASGGGDADAGGGGDDDADEKQAKDASSLSRRSRRRSTKVVNYAEASSGEDDEEDAAPSSQASVVRKPPKRVTKPTKAQTAEQLFLTREKSKIRRQAKARGEKLTAKEATATAKQRYVCTCIVCVYAHATTHMPQFSSRSPAYTSG